MAAIVVVVAVAVAETTSNCYSYNNEWDDVKSSHFFCIFVPVILILRGSEDEI